MQGNVLVVGGADDGAAGGAGDVYFHENGSWVVGAVAPGAGDEPAEGHGHSGVVRFPAKVPREPGSGGSGGRCGEVSRTPGGSEELPQGVGHA
eukprot:9599839-Heterocapsa_arctica.AAC.1